MAADLFHLIIESGKVNNIKNETMHFLVDDQLQKWWWWWWIVFVVWLTDERRSLISSRDHCQRSPPLRISDTPRTGFEPAQNLSSSFDEWSCAVVLTTTLLIHYCLQIYLKTLEISVLKYMDLILLIFVSTRISMANLFKKDRSKLRIVNRYWYAIDGWRRN